MATAIVLAGAGARGAYEAGILSEILPALLAEEDQVVLAGTSAGAINIALMAGTAHLPIASTASCLRDVWCKLDESRVFDVDVTSAVPYLLEVLSAGGSTKRTYGLLDTAPLTKTVDQNEHVDWPTLRRNIGATWVRAAGIVATEVATGSSVVFTQGLADVPPRNGSRGIEYRPAELTGAHVRASAAIPIAFPSVLIDGQGWFADGGTRLNTPIAPARDMLDSLGTSMKRVIIIATHPDPSTPAPSVSKPILDRPDIIDECASILHSLFVDRVAEDVDALRRHNHVIAATRNLIGATAAPRSGEDGAPDIVEHAYFGPPKTGLFAQAAASVFAEKYSKWSLKDFSLISRVLGGKGASHDELLSFLFFDPLYLSTIFEMGRAHAAASMTNGIPWAVTRPPPR
ncbi:MAG TPA: patatin-like phospholipase family protein [Polyangiaceae bacterium]|jgi:NTE family protein|nr:patatin-like phospholipase family protein [Polyangiaceae bacterium]